ncbi:hypothetical protein SAMN05444144_11330 [Flavobacterium akiainvivens]|nr:hypothetical protein SAMN05444144_11330 [Flavobacterium akiainvivens]
MYGLHFIPYYIYFFYTLYRNALYENIEVLFRLNYLSGRGVYYKCLGKLLLTYKILDIHILIYLC